jgi:tetratricopeptide (TPR) repeat protein
VSDEGPTQTSTRWNWLGIGSLVIGVPAALYGAWVWARPRPVLDRGRIDWLLANGDVRRAQVVIGEHLAAAPEDLEARDLLGRLIIDSIPSDRPLGDPKSQADARRGLELLRQAQPVHRTAAERAMAAMYEGKAHYVLQRWREAEADMRRALELDPRVPEAGWALLNLDFLLGRRREAIERALSLYVTEPDARDRVLLLLQLVRQDVLPPDPESLVALLEPVAAADPEDLETSLALGRSLVRSSRADEGVARLEAAVSRFPYSASAWASLLEGLDLAARPEALASRLKALPESMADDGRFAIWRGRSAQTAGRWDEAITAYKQALAYDPEDPALAYRLAQVLRLDGRMAEADEWLARHESARQAGVELRRLYEEIEATRPGFASSREPSLCTRLAELRERMGHTREAALWREWAAKGGGRE